MDGRDDVTSCAHPRLAEDGRCAICGGCPHEIVLNGACYTCGATDVTLTNKPPERDRVVPAARLTRRR